MAKILLVGLPDDVVAGFTSKLQKLDHSVEAIVFSSRSLETRPTDLVIGWGDDYRCLPLLSKMRRTRAHLPFVIVSAVADDSKWIGALEAGATDYAPVDIDNVQLDWILSHALPARAMVSAA